MLELLKRFGRSILAHPHYKILAVLIALTAWWYVQASEVDNTQEQVRIDWVLPTGLVPVEPLPAEVLGTFSGSRNALRRMQEEALLLPIDLADVATEAGPYSLELNAHDILGLPPAVSADEVRPGTLTFVLDEVVERSVKVEPVVVGEPDEGFMVAKTRLEPSVVEVRGPRVALANLLSVETEPINVDDLRHDKRFEVRLDLPRTVSLLGTESVEARVDIEAQVESRSFSQVPLYVRGQQGWVVRPETVRVRLEGPAASLRQIDDVDVVAQIFLPDTPTRTAYDVSFDAQDGVRAEISTGSESVRVVEVEPSTIQVMRP